MPESKDTQRTTAIREAAYWYAALCDEECSIQEQNAHKNWLQLSVHNQQAWQQVEALNAQLGALPGKTALTALQPRQGVSRRTFLRSMAFLGGAGLAGWHWYQNSLLLPAMLANLKTGTGERRQLLLTDGSRMHLNTATAVDIHPHSRQIYLITGEIMLETVPNLTAQQKFSVRTADGLISPLGTRYTVHKRAQDTRIEVLEHSVKLIAQSSPPPVLLKAGQAALMNQDRIVPTQEGNSPPAVWKLGLMTVNNWTLADFTQELNRYRPGIIQCAPEVGKLRLSGAYPVDDTDQALQAVARALPVRIQTYPFWTRILPRQE